MAKQTLRRGLPRLSGGEPWPPARMAAAAFEDVTAPAVTSPFPAVPEEPIEPPVSGSGPAPSQAPANPSPAGTTSLRRGLPRSPGGEPWPPATESAGVAATIADEMAVSIKPTATKGMPAPLAEETEAARPVPVTRGSAVTQPGSGETLALRRGLPRTPGAEPWPPEGTVALVSTAASPSAAVQEPVNEAATDKPVAERAAFEEPRANTPDTAAGTQPPSSSPAIVEPTSPGAALSVIRRPGRKWPRSVRVAMGAAALIIVTGLVVFVVRALLATEPLRDFVETYPGEYHLPSGTPVGIPALINWQHFFNVFLMVLIIRSGLRVRSEKRPTAFWTPRRPNGKKISLTLWFHQSLDLLWLVNGVIFVVVLFADGQWARIVPTSWEVFPNALSALLQYVSFDWPTENGWNNYNSLQQLAYFTTVFLAAPVAAVTGFRMSDFWPKQSERLSMAYKVEWARALHFPVMLYFVAFIVVHVFLVFTTGALRNLNHMYASQDEVSWVGFWIFVASVVVIVGAWFAARPLFLAPVARLFGKVSGR